jgi:hypothetical protein
MFPSDDLVGYKSPKRAHKKKNDTLDDTGNPGQFSLFPARWHSFRNKTLGRAIQVESKARMHQLYNRSSAYALWDHTQVAEMSVLVHFRAIPTLQSWLIVIARVWIFGLL